MMMTGMVFHVSGFFFLLPPFPSPPLPFMPLIVPMITSCIPYPILLADGGRGLFPLGTSSRPWGNRIPLSAGTLLVSTLVGNDINSACKKDPSSYEALLPFPPLSSLIPVPAHHFHLAHVLILPCLVISPLPLFVLQDPTLCSLYGAMNEFPLPPLHPLPK